MGVHIIPSDPTEPEIHIEDEEGKGRKGEAEKPEKEIPEIGEISGEVAEIITPTPTSQKETPIPGRDFPIDESIIREVDERLRRRREKLEPPIAQA